MQINRELFSDIMENNIGDTQIANMDMYRLKSLVLILIIIQMVVEKKVVPLDGTHLNHMVILRGAGVGKRKFLKLEFSL